MEMINALPSHRRMEWRAIQQSYRSGEHQRLLRPLDDMGADSTCRRNQYSN
ncbi:MULTISPECIES: hypothetical protein [Staphylococcus]|uniref:hypothetical protein n=1 Tax=Staphylococcus TaxID=1279 RepID=UPI0018E5984B|nr:MULTISPECIES: hypothetical protein [Staphylococcus]MCS4635032.1 hypothetical protein [Staphylococcus aureus]